MGGAARPRCHHRGAERCRSDRRPINTVAEVVKDPQLWARGMLAEHWDEGAERTVLGPGVIPVLSESPGTIRNAGSARPGQHNDEVYVGLLGKTSDELDTLRSQGVL